MPRLSVNMHVFVWPELAELHTLRRSVRLTVVVAVWLSELMPHGFSKGHGHNQAWLANHHTHSYSPTRASRDEVAEKTDRLTSSVGTSRKMTPT